WARNWSGLAGLIGSWYLSCVTSSRRNMSLSISLPDLASDVFDVPVAPIWLGGVMFETEGMVLRVVSWSDRYRSVRPGHPGARPKRPRGHLRVRPRRDRDRRPCR